MDNDDQSPFKNRKSSGPKIQSIKSGTVARSLAIAKLSLEAGAKAARFGLESLLSDKEDRDKKLMTMLSGQAELLAKELGKLKGSLMKAGQLLSMYGENLFPPEVNVVLKSLQNASPPVEWSVIEKVIVKQIPGDNLKHLEIDPEPYAAASLGQVHLARDKRNGRLYCLKIQYPGVAKAIDSDLRSLRSILLMMRIVPQSSRLDEIFSEVQAMLHREVDYEREAEATMMFREALKDDHRFVVPEVFPEFSSKRILTTSYEEGVAPDGDAVLNLPQERRNQIALNILDLLFWEFFKMGYVQTDPHFGNYRVRLSGDGTKDKVILLDFGAVRKFPKDFIANYLQLGQGALFHHPAEVQSALIDIGFLEENDSEKIKNAFTELCYLLAEPFVKPSEKGFNPDFMDQNGNYNWGESDLLKRATIMAKRVAFGTLLRPPPKQTVFWDRKLGGMFIIMSALKVKGAARPILEKYL